MRANVLYSAYFASYDFYQTPSHITVALYIKGYAGTDVRVDYHTRSVEVVLPEREDVPAGKFTLGPLAGHIAPGESSERVLGTKVSDTHPKGSGDFH